ncbi:MAG: hypothetical protein ACYCX4_09840 [Bacillota bacterium]
MEHHHIDIPKIWPGQNVTLGGAIFQPAHLKTDVLSSVSGLFGIAYAVNEDSVTWLEDMIAEHASLQCRLIIQVYPACPTKLHHLKRLSQLENESSGRIVCRIHPIDITGGAPINVLCFCAPEDGQSFFVIGSSPDLGFSKPTQGQVNISFYADAALLGVWRNWFDETWCRVAPLTPETISIPDLIPAPGSADAGHAWQSYIERCGLVIRGDNSREEDSSTVTVDETDKSVTEKGQLPSPTDGLGLLEIDEIAIRVAQIFHKGSLISIDKFSRVLPLDAPVKPESLGVKSSRKIGTMSRSLRFRISPWIRPSMHCPQRLLPPG